ncbi:helix-turn-helix transcriptional regulator [Aneurinibacillus sp. Ricciae_BoGa-3]|uniref:helix-turn-helix domain-containing protein n=1 Tax=Aneurinibacillus sp. Ricciae_BoGa-3 TaxID=3022697 RepID=UPI002340D80E|nr:helix-turn-helix transcriptional regulator [Aneurinibacillus sp. Ricciae_BoGa-3]WCK52813.1 helix-turn-helix transcriptional regulator [Aneurinibacillus sp. Ricciae_BoGa-3]
MEKRTFTIELTDTVAEKLELLTNFTNYMLRDKYPEPMTVEENIAGAVAYYLMMYFPHVSGETTKDVMKLFPLGTDAPLKNRIKEELEKRKVSQNAVARELNISKSTLSAILNNRNQPSLDVFLRIWTMLGCPSLDSILYRESPTVETGPTP